MTAVATIPGESIDLADLAGRINAAHRGCEMAARSAVEHAVRAGDLRIAAKEHCSHGAWLEWLKRNCEFSDRTARLYMRVAGELPKLTEEKRQRVANLPLRDVVRALDSDNVHFSSESAEWYTPGEIVDRLVAVLGSIDLDPCAEAGTGSNVPSARHLTERDNGLKSKWSGRVYMNPPYGREITAWVTHLCEQYEGGSVTEATALLPARTDTDWFGRLRDYPRCFIRGRLKFSGQTNSAPFPSMVVYLGRRDQRFSEGFAPIGDLYQLCGGKAP